MGTQHSTEALNLCALQRTADQSCTENPQQLADRRSMLQHLLTAVLAVSCTPLMAVAEVGLCDKNMAAFCMFSKAQQPSE